MFQVSLVTWTISRFAVSLFLVFLIKFILKRLQVNRYFAKFPQKRTHWLLGNVADIRSSLFRSDEAAEQRRKIEFMEKHVHKNQQEGIFLAWIFWKPMVLLTNYKSIKLVLSSTKHLEKGDVYHFWHPQMGLGLLTQHQSKWRPRRKMLEPAFHIDILRNSVGTIGQHAENLVNYFSAFEGKSLDIKELMPRAALDIVCDTVLGVSPDAINVPNSAYVKAIMNLKQGVITRLFNPQYWLDFIFYRVEMGKKYAEDIETINNFSTQIINEWKSRAVKEKSHDNGEVKTNGTSLSSSSSSSPLLATNGVSNGKSSTSSADNSSSKSSVASNGYLDKIESKKRPSLMDILLRHHLDATIQDERFKITQTDMQDEVNTFIEAGHDPAGVSLTWILQLLGDHLDVQEKVYDEIKQILGDVPLPYTWNDLAGLTYLEAVIKECLRIRPPVPFLQRVLDDDIIFGSYTIPKGEVVTLSIFNLHQDSEIYPEPERFDPERFMPDRIKSIPPFAFLPFSGGVRSCLGQKFAMMEMKMILARLLLNYRFTSVRPFESIPYAFELVNRPKSPVEVTIERR